MPEAIRKVNVIGHLNPDTDSICAAISYAYLKNSIKTGRKDGFLDQAGENFEIVEVKRETDISAGSFGFERCAVL